MRDVVESTYNFLAITLFSFGVHFPSLALNGTEFVSFTSGPLVVFFALSACCVPIKLDKLHTGSLGGLGELRLEVPGARLLGAALVPNSY